MPTHRHLQTESVIVQQRYDRGRGKGGDTKRTHDNSYRPKLAGAGNMDLKVWALRVKGLTTTTLCESVSTRQ